MVCMPEGQNFSKTMDVFMLLFWIIVDYYGSSSTLPLEKLDDRTDITQTTFPKGISIASVTSTHENFQFGIVRPKIIRRNAKIVLTQ